MNQLAGVETMPQWPALSLCRASLSAARAFVTVHDMQYVLASDLAVDLLSLLLFLLNLIVLMGIVVLEICLGSAGDAT